MAALFAVHPLRAESVAWVAERKDVLSGLFFMLALWAYVDYAGRPFSLARYAMVAVFFALGLMSKPMVVTLPFVLLLLDYWPLGRLQIKPWPASSGPADYRALMRRCLHLIVEKIPLLVLAAASCLVTLEAQREAIFSELIPWRLRMGNALVSYVAYLDQLLFPAGLAVLYVHPQEALGAWKVLALCWC